MNLGFTLYVPHSNIMDLLNYKKTAIHCAGLPKTIYKNSFLPGADLMVPISLRLFTLDGSIYVTDKD